MTDNDAYELLGEVANGSQEAMLKFYDGHFGLVAGFCRRLITDRGVADEVIQDVFWQVWRQAHDYDAQRAHVTTWLLTIARSRAVDALRRTKRDRQWSNVDDLAGEGLNIPAAPVEDQIVQQLDRERIRDALQGLPLQQRDVLFRVHFEGRTAKEVATMESVPLGTIKTRLRLGLDKLRKALEVEQDDA